MPRKTRLGSRVLKAVSSPLRLEILRLLYERGPMSYTEIMNFMKLNPIRASGRFAYHLKTLLGMDLIEPNVESKKYGLTNLGKAVIEFADQLDENAYKKILLVRTSRFAIENFDGNKIAESLIREADVPIDMAQRIARETEKRLLKLDIKYLTAPLIREFVNAILIERGLEEYRHKLTRLGFPVYDVTQLIKAMGAKSADIEAVHAVAGNRVMEEYTLLNVLPRDIADAHLSGALNLNNLGCWILKINGFMHDLRFFFRYGLNFKNSFSQRVSLPSPKSFRAALSMMINVLGLTATEVACEQVVDFFNVFLAPYVRGLSKDEVKEGLQLFLASVNLSVPTGVSLGIETVMPSFLGENKVFGSDGKFLGVYADFFDESCLIASLIFECLSERKGSKPLFNPSFIVKIRPETFNNEESERQLYEAHSLAVDGLPYFANLYFREQTYASYAATGWRLAADWKEDWELDIVRAGCVDHVTLNLSRAMCEAEREKNRFFENVYDLSEKSLRALEIKYQTIRQRIREGLLPFLTQRREQDPYLRIENSSRLVSFVGLTEAAQSLTGKTVYEGNEALSCVDEILGYISKIVKGYVKKQDARCALSMMPEFESSKRLAALDIEKYGLAAVHVQSKRNEPFYADLSVVPYNLDASLEKHLDIQEKLHELASGCHLAKISLGQNDDAEHLLSITRKIVKRKIGLYTFDRVITYCGSCQKTFYTKQAKCPSCGSVNAVMRFSRENARYWAET